MARIFVEVNNALGTFSGDLITNEECDEEQANVVINELMKSINELAWIALKVGTPEDLVVTVFNQEVLKTSILSFSVFDI